MKVIDLLNKIANGEKLKFRYRGHLYYYNDYYEDYGYAKGGLFTSYDWFYLEELNDEVEIIEDTPISKLYVNNELQYDLTPKEDKKIKRIQSNGESLYSEYIGEWLIHKERYTEYDELLMNKINEIIDRLNGE